MLEGLQILTLSQEPLEHTAGTFQVRMEIMPSNESQFGRWGKGELLSLYSRKEVTGDETTSPDILTENKRSSLISKKIRKVETNIFYKLT
jgi:hypothetical protein